MNDHVKDWLVTGGFVGGVGLLVLVGWLTRDGFEPVATGDMAPAFRVEALAGDTARLSDWAGHVILLNVWATWCPPCRREMPSLERLHRRLADEGLRVVAVSVDDPAGGRTVRQMVSGFVEEHGLTFPVLLDPGGRSVELVYGTPGLPTTFLIDRQGRIRRRVVGGAAWDQAPYSEMVQRLLEE